MNELQTGQPAFDMVVEAWVRPVVAQLEGVDLGLPAFDSEGVAAGTRRERLVEVLGDTLIGYSDLVHRVDRELAGARQKQAMSVIDAGVLARRRAAVTIGQNGRIPNGLQTMAEIELKAYEAAHSVSLRVI